MTKTLVVQLNHPGSEKPFKLGEGYSTYEQKIIREWNNDKSHYRKFIQQKGKYISKVGETPKKADLLFWGEWEGNSWFTNLKGKNPNGIHQPFASSHNKGHQNTDPYIFGDEFYYAICKQKGKLTDLAQGSVILFGSSFKSGFTLDTVFVVGTHQTVHQVMANKGANYSETYRNQSLNQFDDTYWKPQANSKVKLYKGVMYEDNNKMFSYVPSRPVSDESLKGFGRVTFPYSDLGGFQFSNNPTGVKVLGEDEKSAQEIWEKVTKEVIKQQYNLCVKLDEPK